MAKAAERAGINEKTFRRWAKKRRSVVVVGLSARQFVTEAEADAIAALMAPRPAEEAS